MKKVAVVGTCPVCGSHEIDYGVFEIEDTFGYYPCECTECGATYNEMYDLELYGQTEIVEGDKPYDGTEDLLADGKTYDLNSVTEHLTNDLTR